MPGNAPHETPADKVLKRIEKGEPPHKIGIQKGEETIEEEFEVVEMRGESTIELRRSDGQYVTVSSEEVD